MPPPTTAASSLHMFWRKGWNSYSVVNPVRVDPETREILLAYGPSKRVGDRDEVVVIVDSNMDGEADYTYRECATGCIRTEATEHDRAEWEKNSDGLQPSKTQVSGKT